MPLFVSDGLYLAGNPDEGVLQPNVEVLNWIDFLDYSFSTQNLIVDLNLERWVSKGSHYSRRAIEGDEQDHFREVFSDLYERVLSHLNQGGVVIVLLGKDAPIPRSRHSAKPSTGSHNWLQNLGILTECSKIGKQGYSVETKDRDVEWYLASSGDQYHLSLSNDVEKHSTVLATSRSGAPIAIEVGAYQDDHRRLRTEKGNVVLLPQPRTWGQNPMKLARCIEAIGQKRLPTGSGWRRYAEDSESPVSTRTVEALLRRFPQAAAVLSAKDGAGQMEIEDEDDVQDLLDAGLNFYFDDVRPEANVEEFAGSGGRVDFVVGDVGVGIEVKIARSTRDRSRLVEQLTKAKESYTRHSLVNDLYIFIYDPELRLNVPELQDDIGDESTHLIVTPR